MKKTYILEGDGEVIVEVYSHLQEVSTASALEQYPITVDTVREIANGDQQHTVLFMAQAKSFVAPAEAYFRCRFNHCEGDLFRVVSILKAVCILCPKQTKQLHAGVQHVEALRKLPSLDDDAIINRLVEELPAYLVAAKDAIIDNDHT